MPLFLITCYAKSGKSNVSRAEINAFAKLVALIKSGHEKSRK